MEGAAVKRFAIFVLMLISGSPCAQTLSDRVTAARAQPTVEQVLINDLWLALQDAQAPLQAQIATLQAQITTLQGQLATANATIATQAKTITTRNATISTLNKQVATLNSQIASLNATITSLRTQLATWPAACPVPAPCPICPVCIPPPVVVPPPPTPSGTAVLAWDAVPTATGYRAYYGNAPGTYLQALGTGTLVTATTFTLTSLTNGRWYFVVTATDGKNESAFSNEVFKDIGPAPIESPAGTMLTSAVGSIIDSLGAVWTLGAPDASGFPVKMRNGLIDGSAAVLCYSGRAVHARGDIAGGWWKWTDDAALPMKGSWSLVSAPVGC